MEALLTFLNATGSIGIWVLVLVAWKFDTRMRDIVAALDKHIALDEVYHTQTDGRIKALEDK